MGKLHLFYPENDLALARNLEHYTPPPVAMKLRLSGALLGLWYGDAGDSVADYGTDSRWYHNARERYALAPVIYGGNPSGLSPAPWGWSRASRLEFTHLGFTKEQLPSDAALDRMRELSHRRTAVEISKALASALAEPLAPAAEELGSLEEAREYVESTGDSVLKLPWSSSGRGLILVSPSDFDAHAAEIDSLIKRQGSVMGEPKMNKSMDFALLFSMEGGKCSFDGYSLFRTVRFGAYESNILATQKTLHDEIELKVPFIDAVADALPSVLEDIIGRDYDGALGVDMMAVEGTPYCLAPAVELNLRMTMGHVCRLFYEKHVVDGRCGIFSIRNEGSGTDETQCSGSRIYSGVLSLSPPHSPMSFQVEF